MLVHSCNVRQRHQVHSVDRKHNASATTFSIIRSMELYHVYACVLLVVTSASLALATRSDKQAATATTPPLEPSTPSYQIALGHDTVKYAVKPLHATAPFDTVDRVPFKNDTETTANTSRCMVCICANSKRMITRFGSCDHVCMSEDAAPLLITHGRISPTSRHRIIATMGAVQMECTAAQALEAYPTDRMPLSVSSAAAQTKMISSTAASNVSPVKQLGAVDDFSIEHRANVLTVADLPSSAVASQGASESNHEDSVSNWANARNAERSAGTATPDNTDTTEARRTSGGTPPMSSSKVLHAAKRKMAGNFDAVGLKGGASDNIDTVSNANRAMASDEPSKLRHISSNIHTQ